MKETLRRICDLQKEYSSSTTPAMKQRGQLIRQTLVNELRAVSDLLSGALGPFGDDLLIEGSDGITNKTELAWTRFCSKSMSPRATAGFYVVLHFSMDGSGVNIAVGCSSSKFRNGYTIVLPPAEIDQRCSWARKVVIDERGSLEPFTDSSAFGATAALPRSFERACAFVKKVHYDQIDDDVMLQHMVSAAEMLKSIYTAQREGHDLSPANQVELDILEITRPALKRRISQGFGLNALERKAVEDRSMWLAEQWLKSEGYKVKNTAATEPYDFEATNSDGLIYVEVKGSTSDQADAVLMTHGEVALHRREKGRTALFIVTGIRLEKDPVSPKANGGELEVVMGWDIDKWMLEPIAFRVSR